MQIHYDVPLIRQGLQQCVQASTAQLLQYYGIKKSIDEIRNEVPIYISSLGVPLGSSLGHIAAYMISQNFDVTIHTVDTELFDQSWKSCGNDELITNLQQRKAFLKHPRYEHDALDAIIDGYTQFLKAGGNVVFPLVDESYLVELLINGPVFCVLNYNFLNTVARGKFDRKSNSFVRDAISGSPSTHAVVISGYEGGSFMITDPDDVYGGVRKISSGHLIGSFYLAETDFDCVLITLKKK